MNLIHNPYANIRIQEGFQETEHVDDILNSFPKDTRIDVKSINGKKEGKATLFSGDGVPLAELYFKHDRLDGHCLFMNKYGDIEKKVNYKNGVADGYYCIFDNNSIIKMGINRNGKEYCELRKHSQNSDYLEEIIDNEIICVCKYSKEFKRDGLCTLFANGRPTATILFENGIEKEKKFEFLDNQMTIFDKKGRVVYRGEYKGDAIQGFVAEGNGCCYSFESGSNISENGMKKYEGECKNGLPYGKGVCYDVDGSVLFDGKWKNGLYEAKKDMLYKFANEKFYAFYDDGKMKYKGMMKSLVPNGKGIYYNREGKKEYEGEWKNGLIEVKNGMWFNFESEKMCRLYDNGQKKYEGDMVNGIPNGKGVYYDKNGDVLYEGDWIKGIIELEGGGVFDYQKGIRQLLDNQVVIYEGDVINGVAQGHGRLVDRKGNTVIEGEWDNGILKLLSNEYIEIDNETVFIYEHIYYFGCLTRIHARKWNGERDFYKKRIRMVNDIRFLSLTITELIVAEGACNNIRGELVMKGFNLLRRIIVKKNAMRQFVSVQISECNALETFLVENGDPSSFYDRNYSPFENVKFVELKSNNTPFSLLRSSTIQILFCWTIFIL